MIRYYAMGTTGLFVLMLLCGTLGFWFYIACWIILPVNNALPYGNDNNNGNYNG